MGHSAGGHLALLYAYKAAKCASCPYNDNCGYGDQAHENCPYDKHKVSPAIPIELVISEAGPTYFCKMEGQQIIDLVATPDVCNLVGINYKGANGYTNDEVNALVDASPLNYANTS